MEIAGEYTFGVPQEMAWEVLRDPKVLAIVLPMAMNMKQVDENRYTGTLFFRVGNIAGTFQGKIELSNIDPPTSYDIEVQGSSPVGHVHIKGAMRLESQGDQTNMIYSGDANFGGRIASVGSRMLTIAVDSILQQSFDTLDRYLIPKYKKP